VKRVIPLLRPMTPEEDTLAAGCLVLEVWEPVSYPDCAISKTCPYDQYSPFVSVDTFFPYKKFLECGSLPEREYLFEEYR
jgi:hypothetical protein